MKLFFTVVIVAVLASGGSYVQAQEKGASAAGTVMSKKSGKTKKTTSEISRVDFENFTFPQFIAANSESFFTLKNGKSAASDTFPKYSLRKTYYFDLTGDEQDEAISHIIAEGCQMGCEKSNLFYIHTLDGNREKLYWKIATGGDVFGGLKSAHFDVDEIIMEVFGDCRVENQIIKPEIDMQTNAKMRTTNYTRLVFTKTSNGFSQTSRTVLPLTRYVDIKSYRAQIRFGDRDERE